MRPSSGAAPGFAIVAWKRKSAPIRVDTTARLIDSSGARGGRRGHEHGGEHAGGATHTARASSAHPPRRRRKRGMTATATTVSPTAATSGDASQLRSRVQPCWSTTTAPT